MNLLLCSASHLMSEPHNKPLSHKPLSVVLLLIRLTAPPLTFRGPTTFSKKLLSGPLQGLLQVSWSQLRFTYRLNHIRSKGFSCGAIAFTLTMFSIMSFDHVVEENVGIEYYQTWIKCYCCFNRVGLYLLGGKKVFDKFSDGNKIKLKFVKFISLDFQNTDRTIILFSWNNNKTIIFSLLQ